MLLRSKQAIPIHGVHRLVSKQTHDGLSLPVKEERGFKLSSDKAVIVGIDKMLCQVGNMMQAALKSLGFKAG